MALVAFGTASALEAIALKATLNTASSKPSRASKTKDHINHLERRLASWSNGDLMRESRVLQLNLGQPRLTITLLTILPT